MKEKIYANIYEKIMDFLIGSMLIPLVMWVSWIAITQYHGGRYFDRISIILLIEICLSVYLGIKRQYLGGGLLTVVAITFLVFFGTCLLNPNMLIR